MPSPFPGMDPYLEHPVLWPGVHQGLLYCLHEALNQQLPAGYAASIGERLYVVQPARNVYADIAILEHPPSVARDKRGDGGAATIVPAADDAPYILSVLPPAEMREVFIEVMAVDDNSRIVTVIEALSHANKAAGSTGRRQYLTKQRQLLQSQTHLLEIDLLRGGAHTLFPPSNYLVRHQAEADYLVCLHRAGQGSTFEVWMRSVRERLPRVRVPLAEKEPDVVVDLQAALDRCYDAGPYRRRVDYHKESAPPLGPADAAWADALLREKGLRKNTAP